MASLYKWISTSGTTATCTATINNIKNNGHASTYTISASATNSNDGTLSGTGTFNFSALTATISGTKTLTYTRSTSINGVTGDFTIKGQMTFSTSIGGTAIGTSNSASSSVAFKQPLDANSCTGFSINNTSVWSNAASQSITATTTFSSTIIAYSKSHTVVSSQTSASTKGYIATTSTATGTTDSLTWYRNTTDNYDVGSTSATITLTLTSNTTSASAGASVKSATFYVKNAVTALTSTASSVTLYRGGTVSLSPTFTPTSPYSKALDAYLKDASNSAMSAPTGTTASGGTGTVSFTNTSASSGTVKLYAKSTQGADTIYSSNCITITIALQTALTGQDVVEGSSITVAGGMGSLTSVKVDSGNVTATVSGSNVTITGTAVTADTNYQVTVTDNYGATNTITGKTTNIANKTLSINPGDKTDVAMGTGDVNTVSSSNTSVCTVAKSSTSGSVTITAVAAGTATVTVTGTNGSSVLCSVTVSNIGITLE